jgi:hypothetical protein
MRPNLTYQNHFDGALVIGLIKQIWPVSLPVRRCACHSYTWMKHSWHNVLHSKKLSNLQNLCSVLGSQLERVGEGVTRILAETFRGVVIVHEMNALWIKTESLFSRMHVLCI